MSKKKPKLPKDRPPSNYEISRAAVADFKEKYSETLIVDAFVDSVSGSESLTQRAGPCGWSVVTRFKTKTAEKYNVTYGGANRSTVNRSCLYGIYNLFVNMKCQQPVIIHTGNLYVYDCATKHMDKWIENQDVENKYNSDFWIAIALLREKFDICWSFVPFNVRKDREKFARDAALTGCEDAKSTQHAQQFFTSESFWVDDL